MKTVTIDGEVFELIRVAEYQCDNDPTIHFCVLPLPKNLTDSFELPGQPGKWELKARGRYAFNTGEWLEVTYRRVCDAKKE